MKNLFYVMKKIYTFFVVLLIMSFKRRLKEEISYPREVNSRIGEWAQTWRRAFQKLLGADRSEPRRRDRGDPVCHQDRRHLVCGRR